MIDEIDNHLLSNQILNIPKILINIWINLYELLNKQIKGAHSAVFKAKDKKN